MQQIRVCTHDGPGAQHSYRAVAENSEEGGIDKGRRLRRLWRRPAYPQGPLAEAVGIGRAMADAMADAMAMKMVKATIAPRPELAE